ncbi:MAG: ParM/StbA family protein [Chloroflexota bacterium]
MTEIVAIDAGNGFTNGVRKLKNRYKSIGFPSVRASVTGESLGLGDGLEMQVDYIQHGDFRYVVGDDVFISRRAVERHQGHLRYGNELWSFLVSVALGQLMPKAGGEVDLTVFAPPELYVDARKQILQRMETQNHQFQVQFRDDEESRIFTVQHLTVHPEGIGAVGAFALDEDGQPVAADILTGETVVLDAGMYTLDALQMSNGNFNPESLSNATWEGQGIKAHILDPVLRVVKKQGDDFTLLTENDVDRTLRQGLTTGDYTLTSGGSSIDIKPAVDKYALRYADWISNNIIDGVFNGLRGIKSMILVGGGTSLIQPHLLSYYGDNKILDASQHAHVADVAPTDLNAVGGIRLALARQKA